jgi:hypothetical protein
VLQCFKEGLQSDEVPPWEGASDVSVVLQCFGVLCGGFGVLCGGFGVLCGGFDFSDGGFGCLLENRCFACLSRSAGGVANSAVFCVGDMVEVRYRGGPFLPCVARAVCDLELTFFTRRGLVPIS